MSSPLLLCVMVVRVSKGRVEASMETWISPADLVASAPYKFQSLEGTLLVGFLCGGR